MKLTIIGATGGTGGHILDQALAAGDDVTVLARNPNKLAGRGLRTVAADLAAADPTALESAVAGADAVLSSLGPRGRAEVGIAAIGTQAVVDAMKATGVRRLVVISSESMTTVPSPGRPNPPTYDPGEGFVLRHVVGPLAKRIVLCKHYADLGVMEDIVRASGLDWTIARPTLLTNTPATRRYRTANGHKPAGGDFRISRADLAHFMLAAIEQLETVGQAVTVTY